MGTVVRVRGVKRFRDRHGKWRCYHRKTGKPIKAEFGSGEFFVELARLDAIATIDTPRKGTLGALFVEWRSSAAAESLSPRSRRDYERVLDYLKPLDGMPLHELERPFIVRLRDKTFQQKKRRFANYVVAVLSSILSWGVERGYLDSNPCRGIRRIKRPKELPRANRPWQPHEVAAVLDAAPPHVQVPLALCAYAGLRGGDAVSIPRDAYDGESIVLRTSKTGQEVWLPVPAPLRAIIDSAPAHDAPTLAANSKGESWTVSGFRTVAFKIIRQLAREGRVNAGLTIHGLRHTVAVRLREAGFDERTIADVLGQATPGMALHYAKGADLRAKMRSVVKRLDAEAVKPQRKSVKPGIVNRGADSVSTT